MSKARRGSDVAIYRCFVKEIKEFKEIKEIKE
jgi:hypothetical protein